MTDEHLHDDTGTAQPNGLSKLQLRTLEDLHANFAQKQASSLSLLLRAPMDSDIKQVDQTTYSEFIQSLSNPCCAYTFSIEGLGGQAIIAYSQPLVYSFIDMYFGASGGRPSSKERSLTGIERIVMDQVTNQCLSDLEIAWQSLLNVRTSNVDLQMNPGFIRACGMGDQVVLMAFEITTRQGSGRITLCYPYKTLDPVLPHLEFETWDQFEKQRQALESAGVETVAPEISVPPPISPDESLEQIATRRPEDVAGAVQYLLTQPPYDEGGLAGPSRAGILIAALGRDLGRIVLRHCSHEDREQVSRALDELWGITARQKDEVFEEVRNRLLSGEYNLPGMIDEARSTLRDFASGGFSRLQSAEPTQIVPLIVREHPQTIALILSQLEPAQAATALQVLPEDLRVEACYRLARIEGLPARVLRQLADCLERELEPSLERQPAEIGGPEVVATILNQSGRTTEKQILAGLDGLDPELGEAIRNEMVVFDDISSLTDPEIRAVLENVDENDLAIALKCAGQGTLERMFANLGEEGAQKVREEMERSQVRVSDVEDVQLRILEVVRKLEDEGEVTIAGRRSADQIM